MEKCIIHTFECYSPHILNDFLVIYEKRGAAQTRLIIEKSTHN